MSDPHRPRRPRSPDDADWADDWAEPDWAAEPRPARRPGTSRPLWASARLAGLLAVALVGLVALAVVVPGNGPARPPVGSPTVSAGAGLPTATPQPSFVRPTPTPQPTFLSVLVQAGDSLNSIARQYQTTARSIAFWNRATYPSLDPDSDRYEPGLIQVGWRLVLIPGVTFDESARPSPSPGSESASPTVRPSRPAATPPPSSGGPATVLSHGPRGTNRVALTFDMGGRLDPAVALMEWLVAHDVRATIFPTGKQGTETGPGRAVLTIIRDHPERFELGNHSWDHPSFTDLSAGQMRDQLGRAEEAVAAFVGRTTKPWFRPPFGSWDARVRSTVGQAGWGYLVMWDVDTIDWRPEAEGGPTADDIVTRVLADARGGSIVLMHLGGWNTLEALPRIVDGLRARGLEPVGLSELLAG